MWMIAVVAVGGFVVCLLLCYVTVFYLLVNSRSNTVKVLTNLRYIPEVIIEKEIIIEKPKKLSKRQLRRKRMREVDRELRLQYQENSQHGFESDSDEEGEEAAAFDFVDEIEGGHGIGVGLAGEADDEVARHRDARAHRAQLAHRALVFHRGVAALHRHQDAVAAVLHRQVQVVHQLRHPRVDVDQPLRELVRMAGGVADALDAGDLSHVLDQQREVGDLGRRAHRTAVRVDVLAEKRHLLHPLRRQPGHFGQHVVERARDLLAAGVRHDAVAAVLGAAFHDRDERGRAVDPRRRQVIELLDLREADVDLRAHLPRALVQQLGQAVQRLRAEHHVDVRGAGDDRLALLARDAAAHPDQHAPGLQVLDAAEVAEHLLLRLLAHRAGVEQDQVGLLDVGGGLVALRGAQHVGHLVRVVLVHLAAEGLDEDLLHGLIQVIVVASNCQVLACSSVVGHGRIAASSGRRIHTSRT